MKKILKNYLYILKKVVDFILAIWKKGFFHVLIANGLVALVAFGSQLFVAKVLSDVELGYIKLFQSYTQILSLIAGMGFSTSVLIMCSGTDKMKVKFDYFSVALYSVVPISLLVLFIFILLNQFNLWTNIVELKTLFNKYSFIIIFTSIIALYTSFIQSSRIFKKYSKLVIITKIISIFFIIFFTYVKGFYGFFDGLWIGLVFSLIFNIFFVKKEFKIFIKRKIDLFFFKTKQQFKIGIHGLGTNIFGIISSNIDVIFLSFFLINDLETIGQYSFASIIITGLSMIQSTIVQVAVPYLSKYRNDEKTKLFLFKKYTFILLIGTIILLILLYILIPLLINLLYGNKFEKGEYYLSYLLGVWFFKCLNAINGSFFLSNNRSDLSNMVNFLNMIFIGIIVYFTLKYFDIIEMIIGCIIINLLISLYSFKLVRKYIINE